MIISRRFVFTLFLCLPLGWVSDFAFAQTTNKKETKDTDKKAKDATTKFERFSPDGKFEILMPGKPKDMSRKVQGLNIKIWTVEAGNDGAYLVSSTELPGGGNLDEDTLADTLDKSATGQVQGMGGKETQRTKIKLAKKYPGLQVEADLPKSDKMEKGGITISRIFIIDGQLYQVLVLGQKDFVQGKDAEKFLDSFQVDTK